MQRGVYWFFIFLILLAFANASTYDTWVLSGETINFNEQDFLVLTSSDWEIASIEYDDEVIIASNQSCGADAFYRLCYEGARWDQAKGYGEYDSTTSAKTPELHITISNLAPTVTVARSITKSDLIVNEETDVIVTISHTGEKKIENVVYTEIIPNGFQVTETEDIVKKGNILKFETPYLSADKQLSYKIKTIRPINASWTSSLKYDYQGQSTTQEIGQISVKTIEITNPLQVSTTLSKANIDPGHSVTYTATLTPSEETQVHSFVFDIPKNVEVKDYSDEMQFENNNIEWAGVIDEVQVFEVDLKFLYAGSFELNTTVVNEFYSDVEEKYHNKSQTKSNKLVVDLTKISAKVDFMLDRKSIKVGNKSNIKVLIENKDSKTVLFDVNYYIKTGLFGNSQGTVEALAPGEIEQVYFKEFYAPSLEEDSKFIMNVTGSYRTQFYQEFDFDASDTLSIGKDPDFVAEQEPSQVVQQEQKTEDTSEEESEEEKLVDDESIEDSNEGVDENPKQKKSFFSKIIDFFRNLF